MKRLILLLVRTVFAVLSMTFFPLFFLTMLQGIINIGNLAGMALCVWIFCVSVAPLQKFIKKIFCKHKFTKFIYRAVNLCFIIFAVYGTVVTGLMAYCACKAPAENATAIVLGAQVRPWGPSAVLYGRISGAESYLKETPDACAVLSGGQGEDEPMSEAQCMYNYLSDDGIDESRLYKEDKSVNTTENIRFSMEIIEENNLNTDIAIATDSYHQLRAQIIARQQGIKGNVGAVNSDTSFIYIPTFAVREWFALPYQVLFR